MMSDYTYGKFRLTVDRAWATQPAPRDIRLGQMYFNALQMVRPDIANQIRATRLDPFHRDEISMETELAVEQLW